MKVFTPTGDKKNSSVTISSFFQRRYPRIVFTILMLLTILNTQAQFSLTTINTLYTQDFNTLAQTGTSSTVPAGWLFVETGGNTTYTAGTGSGNTGDTYSFGSAALPADRAFGQLRSGSVSTVLGVVFTNNTNSVITSLAITYTGEQWRLGLASRPTGDKMDFQYSSTASAISGAGATAFQDFDALDFTAPILSGTVGALDGNNSLNRAIKTATITLLPANFIPPGGTFAFRWNDVDITNSDDGLAVDDFNLTATGSPSITTTAPPSAIGTTTATLGGNISNDGGSAVTGRGVVWSVTATNATPAIGGSGVTDIGDPGTTGAFSVSASSLPVNTQISYRAYGINALATGYGGTTGTTFYTRANDPNAPNVTNPTTTSLDVTIGAGDGNPAVTTYAIQDAGSGNYVQLNGTLGATVVWQTAANWAVAPITVTGLTPSTLYTFQVKARNVALVETGFGAQASNTTTTPVTPGLNGSPLADFGSICINTTSTAHQFTISGNFLTADPVTVAAVDGFSFSTDDLSYTPSLSISQPGGTFSQLVYVKFSPILAQSYNNNIVIGGGGAPDANVAVTGSGLNTAAAVTTGGASPITQVSGTPGGTITSTGCSPVSDYGVLYSLASDLSNPITAPGNNLSLNSFSVSLTNLSPGTTYYYKAYVTNGGGTTYGSPANFTTSGLDAPVAQPATAVTSSGFTANWLQVTGADSYRLDVSTSPTFGSTLPATELFISEYVEGSSSNKYIEIYNGTGASVNLGNYRLRLYTNGQLTINNDALLSGTLANGATIVYKNSAAAVYAGAATNNTAVNFNGNDAVVLFKISTSSIVDIFGRIGEDPGVTGWTAAGGYQTMDRTLVRRPVAGGVTANPAAGFPTLATEWDVFPVDNVAHLGSHSNFIPSLVVNNLTVNGLSQPVTSLSPATTYYYRVRAFSTNSTSANSTPAISVTTCAVITATAGANGTISPLGATDVCNAANQSYTIAPNACYHVADVLVDGVSVGAVTAYSFNSVTANHTISATFALDATLTAPVVTGPVNVCQYVGTLTQVTYTATSNVAVVYNWLLPPNVNLVSSTANSITVTFAAGFTAQNNKQIRVTASTPCSASQMTIYYLLSQLPNLPSPIVGTTSACTVIGSGTLTYTIHSVLSATDYVWQIPAGTTITHTNGPGVNDTTITLSFDNSFATGDLKVQAHNDCGLSPTRSVTLTRINPGTPGLISGTTNVCENIAPTGTATTYKIASVINATSYNWAVTAPGAVITHPNGLGATDTVVNILFANFIGTTTVTVSATNGCGTGGTRSLSVTKQVPGTPGKIDVSTIQPCPDRLIKYTLGTAGPIPTNATSLQWVIPSQGTIVSDQFTGGLRTSITVSYSAAVDSVVTVQAFNNCGSSAIRSTPAKYGVCAVERPMAKGGTIVTSTEIFNVNVFPNPTVSDFKLQVLTAGKELIHVRILDMQGRAFKTLTVMPYQATTIGADLKAGAYMLEVTQGNLVKTTKLLKF